MKSNSSIKYIIVPFTIFFLSLIASVSLGYYFKVKTNGVVKELFKKDTQRIMALLDNKLNEYKTSYYGSIPLLHTTYLANDNDLTKVKNPDHIFGKTQTIIVIHETPELTEYSVLKGDEIQVKNHMETLKKTNKFTSILEESFRNTDPMFFTGQTTDKRLQLNAIIPVENIPNRMYVVVTLDLVEDLMSSVLKANLLKDIIPTEVRIEDGLDTSNYVLYNNKDIAANETPQLRRQRAATTENYDMDLSAGHINFIFTELKADNVITSIKNFPFMVSTVGGIFSILFFAAIYGIYIVEEKRYTNVTHK